MVDSHILALVALSNAREFAIGRAGLSIGRHTNNDVVIDDPEVSRHHARLWTKPGGSLILEDYSANGTFVNGVRVTHAELHEGDKVRFALRPNNEFAIEPAAPDARKTFLLKQNDATAPRLQVLLNDTTIAEYTIPTSGLVLGSGKAAARANFATLLQPGVAAQHAEIRFSPEGGSVLKDLGSEEGTFVNGKRIDSEVRLLARISHKHDSIGYQGGRRSAHVFG
jgi:ABC transport system ATP-binding/permease protein